MDGKQKKETGASNKSAFLISEVGTQRDIKRTMTLEVKGVGGKSEKISHEPRELLTGSVFSEYKELALVAGNIAEDFLGENVFNPDKIVGKTYKDIIEKGLTYFMSSTDYEKSRSGLLSICPAVLTAMRLWKELSGEKEASKAKKDTSRKLKEKLEEHIRNGIDAMMKIIYRDGEHEMKDSSPVFDASPFEYEEDTFTKGLEKGRSYIDSISWAVPVFLRILNLTNKKDEAFFKKDTDKNLRDDAKFLAKWCLRYTNASVIRDANQNPVGWNYTKLSNPVGAERSLNFTYAASTVYLSFYSEYEGIIEALRTLDAAMERLGLDDKYWKNLGYLKNKSDEFKARLEEVEQRLKDIGADGDAVDEETNVSQKNRELGNEKAEIEKLVNALEILVNPKNAEKLETFMWFNDDKRVTNAAKKDGGSEADVGEVSRLKLSLESVSADIWNKIGEAIEDKFFYDDHELTVANNEAIENGGQTNALFSGLLSIGIMLNAAYDVKINNDVGEKACLKMQEAMLLHIQKTQRFFDDLEERGNAFGVDTLILRFSQKINDVVKEETGERATDGLSDKELADRLRKHYIRVNSLIPLLLKTNNILSKYVIRYPQKQMGESLAQISRQRVRDSKTGMVKWLWETDKYNAVATYYYVDGIFSFYEYYNTYEKPFIRNYEDMRAAFIKDSEYEAGVRKYCESLQKDFQEKEALYNKKLEAKEAEINKALEEVRQNNVGTELVNMLHKVIEEFRYFDSPKFYKRFLKGLRECLADELVSKYAALRPPENEKSLEQLRTKAVLDIKEENIKKNGEVFSLLQALLVDVILPSAIAGARGGGGTVDLGVSGAAMKNKKSAEFALDGRKLLLDDDKVNALFADMFGAFNWEESE